MLIDNIRAGVVEATKARNEIEKNILKLVLGEVDRASQELTDKQVLGIIQGIIKSNVETMSFMKPGTEGAKNLIQENECLLKFIPKISQEDINREKEEIKQELSFLKEEIKTIVKEGQAIGLAVKHFKQINKSVSNENIVAVVKEIRSESLLPHRCNG